MKRTVQARLDSESARILHKFVAQLGWTPSQVVREGLRVLAACQPRGPARTIVGLGKFESGVVDLGSNKDHLQGFGR